MSTPFRSGVPDSRPREGELRWSKSERAAARKAFDHALNQELQEVSQQVTRMVAAIKQPADLWELERFLTQRRKETNYKYEYRGSKLIFVVGTLLHEGRLTEEDLRSLRGDKLEAIRSYADFLSRRDKPI